MISVCIIAKNEEKNITRCLSSVEHIADEIIVVDTGSTDYTPSIAESFGARVEYYPFQNDFAKARNKSIGLATKEWIIYMDCDEQLDYNDGLNLKNLLENCIYEGICLSLINIINEKKQLTLPSLRVFKNRKEYQFEGKIHEQINPSIEKFNGKGKVFVSDIKLYHYGYDSDYADIQSKIKRNISIFESYEENEKDGFYFYNLGNEHLRLHNLEKALSCYIKAYKGVDYNGYKVYIPIYVTKSLHELKRYEEAIKYGKYYLKSYPNYKELHFIIAICYHDMCKLKNSKEHLLKYVEFSKTDYGYPEFNLISNSEIDDLLLTLDTKIVT